MQKESGHLAISAGRKMWSDEETLKLIKIWTEETERVWSNIGKKTLSLKLISDLLQKQGVDRYLSQVEGKIKALKRDYKAVKSNTALGSIQLRMAPLLEKLAVIFAREQLTP